MGALPQQNNPIDPASNPTSATTLLVLGQSLWGGVQCPHLESGDNNSDLVREGRIKAGVGGGPGPAREAEEASGVVGLGQ